MVPRHLCLSCAVCFLAMCAGCSRQQSACHSCTHLTCTGYECYHVKGGDDPTWAEEACDPKQCIKTVAYYFKCYARVAGSGDVESGGCVISKGTTNAILKQTVFDNSKGDYSCGLNEWSALGDCPPQKAADCPCGVVYTDNQPMEGRCLTRPCDGKQIKTGGLPTGRDDCAQ